MNFLFDFVPPKWEYQEPFTGEPLQCGLPMCPSCDEPLYNLDRCCFCGQEILLDPETDAELREYLKRPETGVMVCPECSKKTMEYTVSKYNGHRHGRCTNCNAIFKE